MTAQATAIFGGTFNPVHFGHLRAAMDVYEYLGIKDFRLLPGGTPPHRDTDLVSAHHRLTMLKLAVDGVPQFSIDEREVRRQGPSWMVDTLADIRTQEAPASLVLVIGQDSANTLNSWHRWTELFELANILVMRRSGHSMNYSEAVAKKVATRRVQSAEQFLAHSEGKVLELEITSLPISSTKIRQLIGAGRSVEFLLPQAVTDYIRTHQLYSG